MPYGRGGAGNITQLAEGAKRMTEDVEANHKSGGDADKEQRQAETKSTTAQEYARSGRGGAGNLYSPQTLTSAGKFVHGDAPTRALDSAAQAAAKGTLNGSGGTETTRKMGRGGAGNFVWDEEAQRIAQEQQSRQAAGVQKLMEADVEKGLAKPGRAHMRPEILKD